ncbi:hypothetical protein NM688_g1493 [Phlebia brevispora]|uniref:Uncharacterized protein n=1 Tax=Phlebia brevispora TaxID=194682 RepID=A0ACC1TBP0_9APHY|nr:hypothetical protein NM688_g1493 [Phlebia brevispora]
MQAEYYAERLQVAFTDLKRDQHEVSNLFKSVSANLRSIVTRSHVLYVKWQRLYQEYCQQVTTSKIEASRCATDLSQYTLVLPQILEPNVPLIQKRLIVDVFIQEAEKGRDRAFETERRFTELADRITSFHEDLTIQGTGSWKAKWHDTKVLCTRALDYIQRIVASVHVVFSSVTPSESLCTMLCTLGARLFTLVKYQRLTEPPQELPSAHDLVQGALDESGLMQARLDAISDVWNEIGFSCNELATILHLADGALKPAVITLLRQLVEQAQAVYVPLIQGLRTYSINRMPDREVKAARRMIASSEEA